MQIQKTQTRLLLTSSSFLQVTKKYGKNISLHNRGTSHGATKESSLKGTGRLIVQGAVLSTTAALKTAAPGAFPNARDEKKGVFSFSWYLILVERSFHGVLDPSLSEVGSSKEKRNNVLFSTLLKVPFSAVSTPIAIT